MPLESIRVSSTIPASPGRIYRAWLDSAEHGAIIGGKARIKAVPGGRFAAWDDYITGVTVELEPGARIVQKWRTTEFPPGHPDSRLEVLLAPVAGGTKLTLVHTDIPEGQGEQYEQGWRDYYLAPMQQYFAARPEQDPAPAATQAEPVDPDETIELVPPLPPLRKPRAATPAKRKPAAKNKPAAKKPAATRAVAKKKRAVNKPAAKKAAARGKRR